jgi:hypothetical protein
LCRFATPSLPIASVRTHCVECTRDLVVCADLDLVPFNIIGKTFFPKARIADMFARHIRREGKGDVVNATADDV